MHEANNAHCRVAEQHELAAHRYCTAAEHNEKGDNETGDWHAKGALFSSDSDAEQL
jgi:hypothetical protein